MFFVIFVSFHIDRFVGTKWCGPGNVAANENSLGVAAQTDVCCRQHDQCSDIILAGQSSHGLTNTASYTRCR